MAALKDPFDPVGWAFQWEAIGGAIEPTATDFILSFPLGGDRALQARLIMQLETSGSVDRRLQLRRFLIERTALTDGEEWRPVVGWESQYEVSSLGRVRSVPRIAERSNGSSYRVTGTILKLLASTNGYIQVSFRRRGKSTLHLLHRVVCRAFHGDPGVGFEVAHADGVRTNCAASNLRWATRRENHADKRRHGTLQEGESHHRAKLSAQQVLSIRAASGASSAIAAELPVSPQHIRRIRRGELWRSLD